MATSKEKKVFKKGSTTYFYSSIFFPKEVKKDVFTLYAFVRTADDFVDSVPQQKKKFLHFKNETLKAFQTGKSRNDIIDRFIHLCKRKKIKKEWVKAFLQAMESDLHKSRYNTIVELEKYMYGSAEVIGLMMARIMNLPEKSYPAAALQGKSMQIINFIRDIQEDNDLRRLYIPFNEIKKYGFSSLNKETALARKDEFINLTQMQIDRYLAWQKEAEKGYTYIPHRYLVPVKTAASMYKWTAEQIRKDPFIIFDRKVKPSKMRIILTAVRNFFLP